MTTMENPKKLSKRIEQYQNSISKSRMASALSKHSLKNLHQFRVYAIYILEIEIDLARRLILEVLLIITIKIY